MKRERIKFFQTEIILIYEKVENMKKSIARSDLTYEKIQSVTIEECTERKLFKSVPSQRIVIKARGIVGPIVYYQSKEKEFFEDYKNGLRKFCKDNRILLYDHVAH